MPVLRVESEGSGMTTKRLEINHCDSCPFLFSNPSASFCVKLMRIITPATYSGIPTEYRPIPEDCPLEDAE